MTVKNGTDEPGPEPQTRPFYCQECGAQIGRIIRRDGVTTLLVFRVANRPESVVWEGSGSGDVMCSECREVTEWHMPENALRELLERRRRVLTRHSE